jgi:phage-related minor tail protein
MTKKLEELFNMEDKETAQKQAEQSVPVEVTPQQIKSIEESYKEVTKITGDLPKINELDALEEKDLDSLADKAEKAYDDLMDLGMNVEVRYSGRIFEVASSMLKNAIDAKTAKVDKKLKAVDLQLKKFKLDQDSPEDSNDVLDGKGYVMLDRNELIKKLSEKE